MDTEDRLRQLDSEYERGLLTRAEMLTRLHEIVHDAGYWHIGTGLVSASVVVELHDLTGS